jgi:cardiolipin synthase
MPAIEPERNRGGAPESARSQPSQLWTVPNLLTCMRLVLVPFIVYAILTGRHRMALAAFFVAALTDALDGPIARYCGTVTAAGAYFDPIADKLLMSAVYLSLAAASVPWWFVGIVFGRDLLILAFSGLALILWHHKEFPPSIWGKASTFFQVVTAVVWLARNAAPNPVLDALARGMLWPTAAITIASGIHYGTRGLRLVRNH